MRVPATRLAILSALAVATNGCGQAATDSASSADASSTSSTGAASSASHGAGGASATSTTTSMTSGSGGVPPKVIGKCDALPAPGTWESITPPGVATSDALTMDPFTVGTIWLGADPNGGAKSGLGGVWKSTDCGATWEHVNTGKGGSDVDTNHIWSMAVDFIDPGVLYVIGQYGAEGLWKSTNGGVDFEQLMSPGSGVPDAIPNVQIGSVSMDPNDPLHLVVGTHINCSAPHAPACGAETKDGGATWTYFDMPFAGGWAEQAGPFVIDESSWIHAAGYNGLWLTRDRGVTWKNVAPPGVRGANGGEFTHRPIWRGKNGTYYLPAYAMGGLLSSSDAETWTLVPNSPNGSYEIGLAVAGGRVYLGDFNARTIAVASEDDLSTWTKLPDAPIPDGLQGPQALEYDDVHHVLYSSNFSGGLWRFVTE